MIKIIIILFLGLTFNLNVNANEITYLECYSANSNKKTKETWIIDLRKKIIKEFKTNKDFKITSIEEDLIRGENKNDNVFFNRFTGEMMKMVIVNNSTNSNESEYYKCISKERVF